MISSGTHIVTRCEWNTIFDSKPLAGTFQNYLSKWSNYKMQQIIDAVFDRFCPDGQTLKIKRLAIDLGTITYEHVERELPMRLKEALYDALYGLIMYPKNGDEILQVFDASNTQLAILKTFLTQGILPWNYQESYGSANQMMRRQLHENRLELIHVIQEIGAILEVRKRIAWQFEETVIKKIIIGLEPNNHQQIIQFSEEFVKVQKEENVLKTGTLTFKKNLWLWILNYLFVDRGTIFNKIAFVRSTIAQIANHFNISYDMLVELIESTIRRNKGKTTVNTDFIAILSLLSDELHHKSYKNVKTQKQQEYFWKKVEIYFSSASARKTAMQKNEFNELVINLSKKDTERFRNILLQTTRKPNHWKVVLTDLIPAAIENLFVSLAPSQSKTILNQIAYLSSLKTTFSRQITTIDLYTYGVEFCIEKQHASIAKQDFLNFVIAKITKIQPLSTFAILQQFIATSAKATAQKSVFIPVITELKCMFQKQANAQHSRTIATKTQHALQAIVSEQISSNAWQSLEENLMLWLAISPNDCWEALQKLPKNTQTTACVETLINNYGIQKFLKYVTPEIAQLLEKFESVLRLVLAKHPKHSGTLRALQLQVFEIGFSILWNDQTENIQLFFSKFLTELQKIPTIHTESINHEVLDLVLKHPKLKTLGFSAKEMFTIQQQYKREVAKTAIEIVIELTTEAHQQQKMATVLQQLIRSKKTSTPAFQKHQTKIVHYLLADGIQIQQKLIATYLSKISKQSSTMRRAEIEQLLDACFWQTLVAYALYNGQKTRFYTAFKKTVMETFSGTEKVTFGNTTFKKEIQPIIEAVSKKSSKTTVVKLLAPTAFVTQNFDLKKQKALVIITEYLLPNGTQLYAKLKVQSFKKFKLVAHFQQVSNLEKLIAVCFRETLLNYNSHKGNSEKFTKLFEEKLQRFLTKQQKSIKILKSDTIVLQTPMKLSVSDLFETLEALLKDCTKNVVIGNKNYAFSEILVFGLETSPRTVSNLIQKYIRTPKQITFVQNSISFEAFIMLICKNETYINRGLLQSFCTLFKITNHFGNTQVVAKLSALFWKETIAILCNNVNTKSQLKKLIKVTFDELSTIETLDLDTIVKFMQQRRFVVPNVLKTALLQHHAIFEAVAEKPTLETISKAIEHYVSEGKIDKLTLYVLTKFELPTWFHHSVPYSYEILLEKLVSEQPLTVLKTIRNQRISEWQLAKLSQTVRFELLIRVLQKLYPTQQHILTDLIGVYESITMISVVGISAKELQNILSRKVWKAWQTSNWSMVTNTRIWNELLWETCGKKNVKPEVFVNAFKSIKTSLPNKLQITFTNTFPEKLKTVQTEISIPINKQKKSPMDTQHKVLPEEGISVRNAGLVLLNNYFLMLMERLELIQNQQFKSVEDQENAVHYLQYIVTGMTETEESFLVLNKVLAGLSPYTPVKSAIEMTDSQKELINGLLTAAIGYWPEIGQTSIDGFRGNWLVRDGILRETEERWELTVEKRPYDILMMKAPFSFSIIKLPWMKKPLHVTWPF